MRIHINLGMDVKMFLCVFKLKFEKHVFMFKNFYNFFSFFYCCVFVVVKT